MKTQNKNWQVGVILKDFYTARCKYVCFQVKNFTAQSNTLSACALKTIKNQYISCENDESAG